MSQIRSIERLVQQANLTAHDDGTVGTVANVRFDIDVLAAIMKMTTRSAELYAAAVAMCEAEIRRWIVAAADAGEDMNLFGRARAAYSLQRKITAPPHPGYTDDGSGGFKPIV